MLPSPSPSQLCPPTANANMQSKKDAEVDAIWKAYRATAAAMRDATTITHRAQSYAQAEAFMASTKHRAYVHKWRGWGLLLDGYLNVVRGDVFAFMGIDDSVPGGAKKRKTKSAKAKPPKLSRWTCLRNEFASAHTVDGPMLHLDPNGRDCVKDLYTFSLMVINNVASDEKDPATRVLLSEIERAAWQTIELVLSHRLYCALLSREQLQEALEVALAVIDFEDASRQGAFPVAGKNDLPLLASVIHLVLKHTPYDRNDWLAMLVPFLGGWFETLATKEEHPFAAIAYKIIEIVTDMGRAYFTFIGELLLSNGMPMLLFTMRSWKDAPVYWRGKLAAFLTLFIELVEYHSDSVVLEGSLSPRKLHKVAKAMLSILVDPKALQSISLSSRSSAMSSAAPVSMTTTTSGICLSLDASTVALMACTADIIYFHDRLLQRLTAWATERKQLADGEEEKGDDEQMPQGLVSPVKRSFEATIPMAWEQLIHDILMDASDAHNSSSSSTPQSQSRREQFVQRLKNRAFQHLLDTRLLLLSAVLHRHGGFYVGERIGDVVSVMDFVTQSLEVKAIDKQQCIGLHLLEQLSQLSQAHPDLKSDMFEGFWIKAWGLLLRQGMPYAAELRFLAPQRGIGELVFTILNSCITQGLVPRQIATQCSAQLWALYRLPPSTSSSATPVLTSVSKAPIAFLASFMRLVQPPSEVSVQGDDEDGFGFGTSSIRSRVLQAVFDHLEAAMVVEVNKPEDSRWQATFDNQGAAPAVYAAAFASFLGIPTPSLRAVSLSCEDLKPSLLRAFDDCDAGGNVCGGPDIEGFGAHFTFQDWGIPWLAETNSYIKRRGTGVYCPDSFSPLVKLFRPPKTITHSTNTAAGTRADWEKSNGFVRLHIADNLARRHTTLGVHNSPTDVPSAGNDRDANDVLTSVSRDEMESSTREVVSNISKVFDDLLKKMTFANVDSPYYLKLLDSAITVGLVLACLFAEAKDATSPESGDERTDATNAICPMLKRFLGLICDHFSARTIDSARGSAMMTSSVIRQLMNFHAFILVLQGQHGLQKLTHPCADPLELKIPSELRPAIRKIAATVEASLVIVTMDSDTVPNSKASQRSSATLGSGTQSTPASFDWDSTTQTSQSKSTSRPLPMDVDSDEDDIEGIDSTINNARSSHPSRVLSLWSLRVMLLLKRESGIKAVKKYVPDLGFTPDFLVATASMLCSVSGYDSLDAFVKILDSADEEVSQGKQRMGSNALSLFYAADVMQVLQRCASMYENRKRLHKEEVPESLMATARRMLNVYHQGSSRSLVSFARRAEVEALETFFRLNSDMFGDFINVAMQGLLDVDVSVRFSSAKSLQTLFYMYPDGSKQVYRDLYKELSRLLPRNARAPQDGDEVHDEDNNGIDEERNISSTETCLTVLATLYVCACSSSDVVPDVVLLYFQLAGNEEVAAYARSGLLKEWLEQIAVWYDYPSPTRLVDDHFCFLWSHHVNAFINTGHSMFRSAKDEIEGNRPQRVTAKALLESFPVANVLAGEYRERRIDTSAFFQRHVDVILPLSVLYDVACGDVDAENSHFLLVEEMAGDLMWKHSMHAAEQSSKQQLVWGLTQEQLITDLFALSFVLHSMSTDGNTRAEEIGATMLALAEDMALTHALSISHLGHVVMKMARFTVWNILSENGRATGNESTLECEAEHWLRAMKTMKEKYSGFDWARMNLAEILSEFHEMLLRAIYFEPLASRAIECLCLFVNEIKDAITDTDGQSNAVLLQHLLLHVVFETVKNVKRRDKKSSRKLTFLVRDICDHFMKNSTNAFGKYLNFVVQEIADILVRASRKVDAICLDGDDTANLEWIIFAICNNMASGLGKFMVDVEAVPSGIAASLDRLNSMLVTSSDNKSASTSKRRRSLDPTISLELSASVSDKTRVNALHQIEQFIVRASKVGERFYQPRTVASSSSNVATSAKDDSSLSDAAGMSSQLKLLREHVRVVRRIDSSDGATTGGRETDTQVAIAQRTVLAKLTRTLFTLSTHYEKVSSEQTSTSQVDQLLLAIADILGEIGVWDANEFDLSPGQDGEELSRLYQRHFRRGALRDTKATFRVQMHEQLLQYLSSLMFESGGVSTDSADVLHESLNTVKKVLRLDEGRTAVEKTKDAELRNFLEVFIHAPPSNWSLALPPVGSGSVNRSSRLKALWRSVDSVRFEEWICPLVEEMANCCADDILRTCGPLAGHRTDMAVFLFPYVLWAILTSAGQDSRMASIVNDNLRAIIKSAGAPNRTTDDRVMQLLVHTINFLREIEKAAFVESNGLKPSQPTSNTPTKRTSASPHGNGKQTTTVSAHLNQPAYSCLVDVDLLDIAEAAICVKMPYSAMQFAEMWLEGNHGGVLPSLSEAKASDSDSRIRSILVDAFSFDDDVDGIYGVNDGRTFASQLVTYNREGSFAQSLPLYDMMLQLGRGDVSTLEGVLHSLNRLGYQHLLRGQLDSISGKEETPKIQEHRYELAWKSLQWNSVDVGAVSASTELSSTSSYLHERTLHQTLKALAHRDLSQLGRLSNVAKQQILKSTRTSLFGMESTRESSAALLHLQSIHEIEECAKIVTVSASGGKVAPETYAQLFMDWQKRREFQSKNDYDASEALLSLEEVLAQIVDLQTPNSTLASIHLSLASRSRRAGRVAIAYKSLTKLEDLHKQGLLELNLQAEWKMERAKLLWSQRETRSAIWVAKQLHGELQSRLNAQGVIPAEGTKLRMLFVESLTLTGKWIASQRSESSEVILQEYLHKATQMVDAMSERELRAAPSGLQAAAKAHFALADYMAEMYHQVATRVTSREWLAGKRVAEARQRELAECLAMNEAKQLENRAHIHALNKEVQYDYEERTKVEASVDQFLGGAVRSFGRGLSLSAKSELAVVFRVLSLWFSNQTKPGVNRAMQEIVDSVPSYKFVPLSYQIISRVGSNPTSTSTSGDGGSIFERVLSMLVLKLCEQHPHHALVQLIALKNSGDVEGKGAMQFRANVGDAKAESAKKYLDKLRKGEQRELLESLDVLSNAYVQLALSDTREHHKNSKNIPFSKAPITTFGGGTVNFDQCLRDRSRRTTGSGSSRAVMPAVLTSSIPARPDMDYSSVSRVLSFDNKFSITDSGIHRPKIIYCIGSDGRRFKQLVKGKDDTRQDLVIEQVFDSVNQFLKDDQATRERNLRLRTYKVVPLSPIAGVLEWVDNTVPWGSYLVGRTAKRLSAHERYHPHEWKHADCRMRLKNATHDKLSVYKEIEASFTPVFHHFFLEKYPDPAMWFKRRLAYVQSVAVTSIVGYILGIGDRHSQNILIHEETAELVHIDFGVVFDQGMALFTPETVPFRLTRDLVDGMGVSGVEGVFTRCCEATLQLLRKKSASVVTILEVFVHDPLYRWTLSPLKALKIQEEGHTAHTTRTESTKNGSETDDSSDDAAQGGAAGNNDAAARALIRVKQKLEGYEDPNGNALSIEGQVKQLISAAQDPHNLCALFPGWAPWL